jgi:hypothetical protein
MIFCLVLKLEISYNRVIIEKVRKRQHQYPEFGHTQDEIFTKKLQKSTLAFNRDFTLSFFEQMGVPCSLTLSLQPSYLVFGSN